MSRAAHLDCQHGRSCALVLTLILFQKGQGFFPPLPIAALLRRRLAGGEGQIVQLGLLQRGLGLFSAERQEIGFALISRRQARAVALVVPRRSVRDRNRKPNQTREPRGPSPSGGNSAANSHVPLAPCAPLARSPGCRGSPPAQSALDCQMALYSSKAFR